MKDELEKAAKVGDVTAYRHYWELCALMALRDGLRSGDVRVPGPRRYTDPASFLLTPQQWEPQRLEFCHVVGKPYDVLAWTAEWYFRAETLEAAHAGIVNYHYRLPMTRAFGTGTLSSSDRQRFPVKGKSPTMNRRGPRRGIV